MRTRAPAGVARTSVALALAATLALAAGCRSDGGFGRRDSEDSLAFSTSTVSRRTAEDAEATARNLRSVPRWVHDEVDRAGDEWLNTYILYLEGRSAR
jgi:hypothetical protein